MRKLSGCLVVVLVVVLALVFAYPPVLQGLGSALPALGGLPLTLASPGSVSAPAVEGCTPSIATSAFDQKNLGVSAQLYHCGNAWRALVSEPQTNDPTGGTYVRTVTAWVTFHLKPWDTLPNPRQVAWTQVSKPPFRVPWVVVLEMGETRGPISLEVGQPCDLLKGPC